MGLSIGIPAAPGNDDSYSISNSPVHLAGCRESILPVIGPV